MKIPTGCEFCSSFFGLPDHLDLGNPFVTSWWYRDRIVATRIILFLLQKWRKLLEGTLLHRGSLVQIPLMTLPRFLNQSEFWLDYFLSGIGASLLLLDPCTSLINKLRSRWLRHFGTGHCMHALYTLETPLLQLLYTFWVLGLLKSARVSTHHWQLLLSWVLVITADPSVSRKWPRFTLIESIHSGVRAAENAGLRIVLGSLRKQRWDDTLLSQIIICSLISWIPHLCMLDSALCIGY